jgi:nitrate reductase delta subunit
MSLSPRDTAVTRQLAALLLCYPDEALVERLPQLRTACDSLPPPVRTPLSRLLDHLATTPLARVQEHYVATLDLKRRCSLYLTYYTHGDTRKRGVALLRFKSVYRTAGLVLGDEELPDYLPVVLEFCATASPSDGEQLLLDHRGGLELLRLALVDERSPYAGAVQAVCATLPPLRGDDEQAVRRLAAEGPPAEEVGLDAFAPPEYMPQRLGVRA